MEVLELRYEEFEVNEYVLYIKPYPSLAMVQLILIKTVEFC